MLTLSIEDLVTQGYRPSPIVAEGIRTLAQGAETVCKSGTSHHHLASIFGKKAKAGIAVEVEHKGVEAQSTAANFQTLKV